MMPHRLNLATHMGVCDRADGFPDNKPRVDRLSLGSQYAGAGATSVPSKYGSRRSAKAARTSNESGPDIPRAERSAAGFRAKLATFSACDIRSCRPTPHCCEMPSGGDGQKLFLEGRPPTTCWTKPDLSVRWASTTSPANINHRVQRATHCIRKPLRTSASGNEPKAGCGRRRNALQGRHDVAGQGQLDAPARAGASIPAMTGFSSSSINERSSLREGSHSAKA